MLATLTVVSYGAVCGWPSPTIAILKSQETPLLAGPLNDDQVVITNFVSCACRQEDSIFFFELILNFCCFS